METIQIVKRDGVATITLHRPEVHNAISMELVDELTGVLQECQTDEHVKVLIITGTGKSFASGGDLNQFIAARGHEQAYPLLNKVAGLLSDIDHFPKPVIAMINGAAVGGGCEFAGACHFRFASDRALFGFVQIGMHITTGWGGGSRLLDKLPESKALALLLTGERMSAHEAKAYGFVEEVYPADQLQEEVERFARKIAAQPLIGIEAYMRILQWKREGISQAERIRREVDQCAGIWGSDAHVAVVQKFLSKR
ncbi:enoyl-CoA hydratase/isomerase family protein [Brevibacillus choshinensis]|uniref:enoyl-CoA hydratase/isomerase family protein n=1 Tax=Brevibacillus choshinensis TaxID=54911 RepID=UPI002E1BDE82|nr:enoyl-CoA hydratase/isomerase family protein [Brevibacillus choshinensis]MED4752139.1 enoyl-CoA hydratase/isomerase family protein [Brevibacillus choshinensis]MED4784570.1 enoyl-CoA hydratase/isomerase family protein [Brevibacillus choshinensis]